MILVIATALYSEILWLTVIGFFTTVVIGGIMPNSSVFFMTYFKKNAGVAASVLGGRQYIIGVLVSALATILNSDSLWSIVLIMISATLIASYYSQSMQQSEI